MQSQSGPLVINEDYLSKWWMDIKEEGPVYVPACHFAKMCFIPAVIQQ